MILLDCVVNLGGPYTLFQTIHKLSATVSLAPWFRMVRMMFKTLAANEGQRIKPQRLYQKRVSEFLGTPPPPPPPPPPTKKGRKDQKCGVPFVVPLLEANQNLGLPQKEHKSPANLRAPTSYSSCGSGRLALLVLDGAGLHQLAWRCFHHGAGHYAGGHPCFG